MAYIGNRVVAGVGSAVKVDLDAPTNALRVKSDGRIGIGKSDPTAPLDVAGQIKATSIATTNNIDIASGATTGSGILNIGANRSGNGYGYIDIVGDTTYTDYGLRLIRSNGGANTNSQLAHRGTGQLQLVVQDAGALVAITSNTERMRIDSAGNVGIGLTNPSTKLHVAGTVTATAFAGDGSSLTGIESLPAAIDVNGSAPDDSLVIDSAGNVGIGTSSPQTRLHAFSSATTTTVSIQGSLSAGANTPTLDFTGNNGGYSFGARIQAIRDTSAGGYALAFGTTTNNAAEGSAPTERMRIDTSGRVGIGTATPSSKLEVYDASTAVARVTAGTEIFEIRNTGSEVRLAVVSADPMTFRTSNVEAMRIDSSGDVLPGANGTQDFGSTSLRWANIYTSDLHLNNGIGNYTIVEGEEDLFLYNNKNGKTYKFVLAEVDPSEAPKKMEK